MGLSIFVPLRVETPSSRAVALAALATGIDVSGAPRGPLVDGIRPLHGRIEGDHLVVQRVRAHRADLAGPTLRGRLEDRAAGGAVLVGAVGPHPMLFALLLLAIGLLFAGIMARATAAMVGGGAAVLLAWALMRRSAVREAAMLRGILEPLLASPPVRRRGA